ncbi:hypothetical protein [Actinoplanes regularis]|uniref:Uncharacterized protein n=1 Tax=Actinoplanes regularis TaxID=52697 RepID=A0A239K2Y4_9ACTN|nr:hypothetical protein [Actinoplanes regularis]GIE92348.1 hypothetical protein Are01nite_88280 [Actinoplanes regularis]SNT12042.1 hypothetical protein SAMN06264365_14131 [Actinoplanes regularis]
MSANELTRHLRDLATVVRSTAPGLERLRQTRAELETAAAAPDL